MIAKSLQDDINSEQEDEDQEDIFKKVLPRETFDPPQTPDNLEYLWSYEAIRDKLKNALRKQEDITQIETLTRLAK